MSGIYIPGMEMPRKTGIVSIVLSGDGSALLCKDGVYSDIAVIPVPDHGRLIDADALIDERLEFEARHYTVRDEFDKGRLAGWNDVIRAIRKFVPTIIPADKEGT